MNKKRILLISVGVFVALVASFIIFMVVTLKPVTDKDSEVTFRVNAGTSKITIAENLEKAGLIKSKISAIIYLFFNPKMNLQAGNYSLNRKDGTIKILDKIAAGKIIDIIPTMRITFVEGKRLTDYAKLISDNFDITYDDFINKASDTEFLKKCIEKYDFLDESILNKKLYYPLEGYLAPDTYEFYVTSDSEDIIYRMLDETGRRLSEYQSIINEKKYSVHEYLTMASIIEKEAINATDRRMVSQVIYKRLALNMTLGMDVTTYYGVKKDMKEELTIYDLEDKNDYNTRNPEFKGLPVGSICNPSKESLNAVFNPSSTDYVYFIADVNTGKVFFFNTYEEFAQKKVELS